MSTHLDPAWDDLTRRLEDHVAGWSEPTRVCRACGGRGEVSWNPSRGQEPWFVETATCSTCGGDGVLAEDDE